MAGLIEASAARDLDGARILVADDEIFIALDIEATLIEAGAEVLGPCTTLAQAMTAAEDPALSAATLDIRLGQETTEAVAAVLAARGIPFMFYSGQTLPKDMHDRWPDCRLLAKPASAAMLVAALADLIRK